MPKARGDFYRSGYEGSNTVRFNADRTCYATFGCRTMLTLRMGQSYAVSVVNVGPAIYISPSGPNPIMVQMTVREALNSALDEEMSANPKVFLMGEEVGEYLTFNPSSSCDENNNRLNQRNDFIHLEGQLLRAQTVSQHTAWFQSN
ncbi:uncharacterized protein LOC130724381 [Lotus japonicus]|uniref:uncharacterized protein LOC130724381 n=1 Tax=Lotus japonicus TaxID=34305 RepID=UPI002582BE30|nr:uncharacterized protein LOC130724381 [Lotus japonicus]XP_057431575.1 uncharacterized protein LOC130724381 [Lotus japonicus]XP_057431576.1 uncharacterized protein LOC130724381 [Lotus japonicus]XP_057431577.1 uncharacterized protein LOC130724381 [Lotus japonicus]XP_057431578.1 uncharacterized protein LOC130724381 [Lotus japonicus]XP_057431579.1 uncharacterized protein LOC130724381 [Lotus japonicus]